MKISAMFPSRFLVGDDLQGKSITVEISHIKAEKMRVNQATPEQEKFVLYFEGKKKGLILNKTLAGQIAVAVGADDTDQWPGGKIVLYSEMITVAGRQLCVIRAKGVQN